MRRTALMRAGPAGDSITVSAPTTTRIGDGRWRVGADVDGVEAWLVADAELAANGDAWATTMLLPAAKSGATLCVASDIDSRLAANFERIQDIARRHWGFAGARVIADRLVERAPVGGSAMFFTCGVDSFYTLWKHKESVERLIFVRGLNINLVDSEDTRLWDQARAGVASVAHELGIRAVLAECNLRLHPTFSRVGWEMSHIAAIAGVAHALAPVVSRILVGSSELRLPYGSDPSLDPLWSSAAVELVGDGWEALRLDKVRAIADWPLVHRHLRVCFRSRGSEINCGRCMKCVGTQLRFELVGARDHLETFPRTPLIELVDDIPWIAKQHNSLWTEVLPHIRDPNLTAAIMRLLGRRPSAIERLRGSAPWLRRTASGRYLRRLAKRLFVP